MDRGEGDQRPGEPLPEAALIYEAPAVRNLLPSKGSVAFGTPENGTKSNSEL